MRLIKRETMAKQVPDQIIEWLTSRQLNPGDELPTESELSDRTSMHLHLNDVRAKVTKRFNEN